MKTSIRCPSTRWRRVIGAAARGLTPHHACGFAASWRRLLRRRATRPRHAPLLAFCLLLPATAWAWVLAGYRWTEGEATVYVGLDEPWGSAFESAMADWHQDTRFRLLINDSYMNPCRDRQAELNDPEAAISSVTFSDTLCGAQWGDSVLAVALSQYWQPSLRNKTDLNFGMGATIQSDIIFNSNRSWDVHSGPVRSTRTYDFQRVALHELGHLLGLGHENDVPAMMRAYYSDIDTLQADDIDAVNTLYDPDFGHDCTLHYVPHAPDRMQRGSTADDDCAFFEFYSIGIDSGDYPATVAGKGDVYEISELYARHLRLTGNGSVSIRVHSDQMRIYSPILFEERSGRPAPVPSQSYDFVRLQCGTLYTYNSLPRNALLWVGQSFRADEGARDCPGAEEHGDYALSVFERMLPLLPELPHPAEGGAYFTGGASADEGHSFADAFAPSESIDVDASILPNPYHVGQSGSLYVALMRSTGHTFAKTAEGWQEIGDPATFWERWDKVPFASFNDLPALRSGNLGNEEWIDVMDDFVGSAEDLSGIAFRIYVGYALDSEPDTVHHHAEPIAFFVR